MPHHHYAPELGANRRRHDKKVTKTAVVLNELLVKLRSKKEGDFILTSSVPSGRIAALFTSVHR